MGRKKSATIRTLLENSLHLLDNTLYSQVLSYFVLVSLFRGPIWPRGKGGVHPVLSPVWACPVWDEGSYSPDETYGGGGTLTK